MVLSVSVGTGSPGAGAPAGVERRHGTEPARLGPSPTLPGTAVPDLADTVVRALLSAGLSLAGAQSLIGDGIAGDRVAAAIDELDQALGMIRSAVLELHS